MPILCLEGKHETLSSAAAAEHHGAHAVASDPPVMAGARPMPKFDCCEAVGLESNSHERRSSVLRSGRVRGFSRPRSTRGIGMGSRTAARWDLERTPAQIRSLHRSPLSWLRQGLIRRSLSAFIEITSSRRLWPHSGRARGNGQRSCRRAGGGHQSNV